MYKSKLDKALDVSAAVHRLQYRKGSKLPYIVHPVAVMLIARTVTDNEDTLCACLLHDVLEDGDPKDYDEAKMRHDFGPEVTDIVKTVSKNDEIKDWRMRNIAYMDTVRNSDNQSAYIVCLSDKIHNLKSVLADHEQIGDELWSRFNAGKEDQKWWYKACLKMLQEQMPNSPLVAQLSDLVAKMDEL